MQNLVNIEYKEDSPEKLAAVAGQPTHNYLFAGEVNKLVSAVNTLRLLMRGVEANVSQIMEQNGGEDLGFLTTTLWDHLNAGSLVVSYPELMIFRYQIDSDIYISAFIGKQGIYGPGYLQFVESDFLLISQTPANGQPLHGSNFQVYGRLFHDGNPSNPPTIEYLYNPWGVEIPAFRTSKGEFTLDLNIYYPYDSGDIDKFQVFCSGANLRIINAYSQAGQIKIQSKDSLGEPVDHLGTAGVDFHIISHHL